MAGFPQFSTDCSHKVIGLGLSRTGTMALYEHSKNLGLPAVHYSLGLFAHQDKIFNLQPPLAPKWRLLSRYRLKRTVMYYNPENARSVLLDDTCLFDLPVPLYVEELVKLHPTATYIYTYRSMESWLSSMEWLFKEGRYLWRFNDLDLNLLQQVYGCTTYEPDTLKKARFNYEKKLKLIFSDGTLKFYTVDIERTEITTLLLAKILGYLDCGKGTLDQIKRHNERKFLSNWQKLDYHASRVIPGFQSARSLISSIALRRGEGS